MVGAGSVTTATGGGASRTLGSGGGGALWGSAGATEEAVAPPSASSQFVGEGGGSEEAELLLPSRSAETSAKGAEPVAGGEGKRRSQSQEGGRSEGRPSWERTANRRLSNTDAWRSGRKLLSAESRKGRDLAPLFRCSEALLDV